MKDRARQVTSLVFLPVLTLTLLFCFAYFPPGKSLCAVSAQSTPLNGSFGFALNSWQTKSNTDLNGFAMLGVMNLDGVGGMTGTYTIQIGATEKDRAQTLNGTFAGTYSTTRDSTGGMTLTLDLGVSLKFTFVITEGGKGFNLVATNATGADFRGTVMSASWLAIALFQAALAARISLLESVLTVWPADEAAVSVIPTARQITLNCTMGKSLSRC